MTMFQVIRQTMVLEEEEEGKLQNKSLDISDQMKHDFIQYLKDTNSYEQWRSNIHRQLEEDLQRQVHALLNESEERERVHRLRQQQLRVGQRLPFQQSEIDIPQGVPWSEIDRRNRSVLGTQNSKDSSETRDYSSTINYQKSTQLNHSFDFDSCGYRRRRRYSLQNNDNPLQNSSFHFQNLQDKRTLLTSTNNESSSCVLLYGNSTIKSNKSDILNLLDQQSTFNGNSTTFVNRHGVIISEDGPFWPCDHRIFHPTPKLNTRELSPKEFYSTTDESSLNSKFKLNKKRLEI
ncbi:hypothetical protein I4U23_021210 [Adineta vaga]|nr:hypothetical protein I4U23_021210 [Adineta vaga]